MKIDQVTYRRALPRILHGQKKPRIKAAFLQDRPAILFSPADITCGLVGYPCWGLLGYDPDSSFRMMRNLVLYAAGKSGAVEPGGRPNAPRAKRPPPRQPSKIPETPASIGAEVEISLARPPAQTPLPKGEVGRRPGEGCHPKGRNLSLRHRHHASQTTGKHGSGRERLCHMPTPWPPAECPQTPPRAVAAGGDGAFGGARRLPAANRPGPPRPPRRRAWRCRCSRRRWPPWPTNPAGSPGPRTSGPRTWSCRRRTTRRCVPHNWGQDGVHFGRAGETLAQYPHDLGRSARAVPAR